VANSEGLRKLALEFMPTLDIGIIPNGIDTEKYYPSQKQELAKPIKVLTVCRLISRKRIDLLVKAAGQARELGLDVQLNIAGEGNLMEALKKLANRLKVADRVVFMGRVPVEQMPQVYRDNDIFVMSSEHEGMSNAMLEAMASGLPIITTRCEGVEELITDNGIIVETPGPRDIAAAIKELIQQPQTYSSMSAASRKRAEMFSWSSVASRYLQCYYEVLKRSRAQPPA
jgi:glycosyltransferase involved in cell wall biosynthesis